MLNGYVVVLSCSYLLMSNSSYVFMLNGYILVLSCSYTCAMAPYVIFSLRDDYHGKYTFFAYSYITTCIVFV